MNFHKLLKWAVDFLRRIYFFVLYCQGTLLLYLKAEITSSGPTIKDRNIIRNKIGLLELTGQFGKISHACRVMEYGLDSLHRFKAIDQTSREAAL